MKFLKVANWEKFQHYKDRCPPWIKLHRDLLRSYDFRCLQDASKLHLMLIWLLASQLDNKIPADEKYIKEQIGVSGKISFNELIDKGFLIDDSNTLADRKQSAIVETEAETYTESDKKESLVVPDFINSDVWMDFVKHRGGSKFTRLAATKILNQLSKWFDEGHDVNEILNTTIMNGWKGVFLPNNNGKGNKNGKSNSERTLEGLREWVDGR